MPFGGRSASTLSQLAGVTATQIVFGSATNFGTTSNKLTWNDATNTLSGSSPTATQIFTITPTARTSAGSGGSLTLAGAVALSSGAGGGLFLTAGNAAAAATPGNSGGAVQISCGNGWDGGGLLFNGGRALGTARNGGDMQFVGGEGTGRGGNVTFRGGFGTTGTTANGGGFSLVAGDSGDSGGRSGDINILGGLTAEGAGTNLFFTAGDGGFLGLGGNGGNLLIRLGVPPLAGVNGILSITNNNSNYSTVASVGAVTPGLGPGVAVTLTRWLPVTADGVAGWVPFYT